MKTRGLYSNFDSMKCVVKPDLKNTEIDLQRKSEG